MAKPGGNIPQEETRHRREDNIKLFNPEVRNEWSYTSAPSMSSRRAQGQLYQSPIISQYVVEFMESQDFIKHGYSVLVD
jgi:hypothetical protein